MGEYSKSLVWHEMARRKLLFHRNEEWNTIELWGLFFPSNVKSLVNKGLLIPYRKQNKRCLCWYYPTEDSYNKYIKPIMDNKTLEEIEKIAWFY